MNPQPPNEALRDLAALLGEQATREIVQLFLEDFPASILRLGACGLDDQVRIVHGLKSSALHMGAEGLSRRMGALEDRLSHAGAALSPGELEDALAEFEGFAGPLRAYVAP